MELRGISPLTVKNTNFLAQSSHISSARTPYLIEKRGKFAQQLREKDRFDRADKFRGGEVMNEHNF